jgi:hypothetical protein
MGSPLPPHRPPHPALLPLPAPDPGARVDGPRLRRRAVLPDHALRRRVCGNNILQAGAVLLLGVLCRHECRVAGDSGVYVFVWCSFVMFNV